MARGQSGNLGSWLAFIVIVVIIGGGIYFYGPGAMHLKFLSGSKQPTRLSDKVAVSGALKEEDLKLSPGEVRGINRCISRYAETFQQTDLIVDMDDRYATPDIQSDSRLRMVMRMVAFDGCEMMSFDRPLIRADLVPHLTRFMELAASEFEHYRKLPELKGGIRKFYF